MGKIVEYLNKKMRIFTKIAAVLFVLIAILHAARLIFRWDLRLRGVQVPLWVNALSFVAALVIAWGLWKESK